jgi:hypothetical protein
MAEIIGGSRAAAEKDGAREGEVAMTRAKALQRWAASLPHICVERRDADVGHPDMGVRRSLQAGLASDIRGADEDEDGGAI